MNIDQTRQVLSYLWATHPNAPKLTANDKTRTIAAFFRVLYKFTQSDVLNAVDKACERAPSYIPSAYEIAGVCVKTCDTDQFLPDEYKALAKENEGNFYREYELRNALNALKQARSEDERAACEEKYNTISAWIDRDERMSELFRRAAEAAEKYYDASCMSEARADLCNLRLE